MLSMFNVVVVGMHCGVTRRNFASKPRLVPIMYSNFELGNKFSDDTTLHYTPHRSVKVDTRRRAHNNI